MWPAWLWTIIALWGIIVGMVNLKNSSHDYRFSKTQDDPRAEARRTQAGVTFFAEAVRVIAQSMKFALGIIAIGQLVTGTAAIVIFQTLLIGESLCFTLNSTVLWIYRRRVQHQLIDADKGLET